MRRSPACSSQLSGSRTGELARRLGIAASTCLERVRGLTKRGVIRGYHADIDLVARNRGEIVGFRTSVIYQRVHNVVLTRLP
jgi:DNA-binding Lrp family transcriptional regulator